jgi:cAMP-dependent protein kinase regulator
MAQKARISVSAEVFGKYHMKEAFVAKVVPKNQEVKDKIKQRLAGAFMFMSLEEKDLQVVIDAMDQKKAAAGEFVINEGEPGEELYILESGTMQCTKVINGEKKVLKQYNAGDVFGELALLYNAPRAATIQSEGESLLWVLDRQTFNHIVKDASQKKREKYEDFLSTVPILQNMDHYERSKLADAIKEMKFPAGHQIITQGEQGDSFYILVDGEAYAALNEKPNEQKEYQARDYFGELALLRDEPRAANVFARTDCRCISLDRKSFKRLLGPLNKILKRNMASYMNFVQGQNA